MTNNLISRKLIFWLVCCTIFGLLLSMSASAADSPVGVAYRGHIQNLGDYPSDGSWVDSPEIIGSEGQSKRIEGFAIKLTGAVPTDLKNGLELRYNVHVQNKGWLYDENDSADWPKDGAYAGTRKESLRIEAVKLVLTDADGKPVSGYSVEYRGHVQNVGNLPADESQWLADGKQLGTVGSSLRLEALQVKVVKTSVDPVVYDTAGIYGSTTEPQTITRDVIVAADGVTLQNLTIQGDLTISEAVGNGTVTLNNVTVTGDTFVRGGGVNSVHINGGQYSRIVMEKTASGVVRIVATGVDGLDVVISEEAAAETIILEGAFDNVTVNAPNMTVTTQGTTTIGKMTVAKEAAGSTLNLAAGTTVTDLLLDGKAAIKGQGMVAKAEVNANGVTFDKAPGSYIVEPGVVIPPVVPAPGNGGVGGVDTPATPVAVTNLAIQGVTIPAVGATPVATIDADTQFDGTVAWSNSDGSFSGGFTGSKAYTATITLTANTGYVFPQDITFSVAGTTSTTTMISNAGQTATITAAFPLLATAQFTISDAGMITAYYGPAADVTIPDQLNGITVTAIGDNAFAKINGEGANSITAVTIPASVTAIGANAFQNCKSLTTVTFTGTSALETIGYMAFDSCTNLEPFEIPATVKSIGKGTFNNCHALTTMTFAANSQLTTIGAYAFSECSFSTIRIPAGVTTIVEHAFDTCISLYNVEFAPGSALKTIENDAFYNCPIDNFVNFPAGVTINIADAHSQTMGRNESSRFKATYENPATGGVGNYSYFEGLTHIWRK